MAIVTIEDFGSLAFLRWAGGKQRLAGRIIDRFPPLGPQNTYFEPFLGAGSVFLKLQHTRAVLSDKSTLLINTFRMIRDYPEKVFEHLTDIASADSKSHYYAVRDELNSVSSFSSLQAARFIYLNRASYNGIFRVNVNGVYNVPYGSKTRIRIPNREYFKRVSKSLQGVSLEVFDFEKATESASEGDLVYLDPPYPALSRTAFFAHYTKMRFDMADHRRLAATADDLRKRGCKVVISNADTAEIRNLFSGWHIQEVAVHRFVSAGDRRTTVNELIISSDPIGQDVRLAGDAT